MKTSTFLSLCLMTTVLACAPASGADADVRAAATEAALDAFFSMKGVLPEDAYMAEQAPEGFEGPDATQEQLTAFLAARRKEGANLNEYRHKGTLLLHAIRTGQRTTTLWLLANGADPAFTVQDRSDGFGGRLDAAGVAIQAKAWDILDAILRHPAHAKLSATERMVRYWPLAMAGDGIGSRLMDRQFPLPTFATMPTIASELLRVSLCSGQERVALALLTAEPTVRPAQDTRMTPLCVSGVTQLAKPRAGRMPTEAWLSIERRLGWPLLPYLVGQVATETQARELLSSGVRLPWNDPVATRQVVAGALLASLSGYTVMLRAVPSAALKAAVAEPTVSRLWWAQVAGWPLSDLDWALSQVEPPSTKEGLAALLQAWSYASATSIHHSKDAADRQGGWERLTRHLAGPLPAMDGGTFLSLVPFSVWPRWFELGLRLRDDDWATWLSQVTPAGLRDAWAVASKVQPELPHRALTWLVAPLSVGPIDDAVARRRSFAGSTYWYGDNLEKAQFLAAQGLRVDTPRWLAAHFRGPEGVEEHVRPLVELGLVRVPPSVEVPPVKRVTADCRSAVSPALRRSLSRRDGLPALVDGAAFDSIQAIAWPGDATCAWLAAGGESGGRRYIEEDDFHTGRERLTPCADGNAYAAVWRDSVGHWVPVKSPPQGALVAVRGPGSPNANFVALEVPQGGCGTQPAEVYMPHYGADGTLALEAVTAGQPLFDALALQCSFASMGDCLGQGALADESQLSLDNFIDHHWSPDRDAFLAALHRLDRDRLAAMREAGLFLPWGNVAAEHVSDSTAWPLPEKRRRMAWLLAQRELVPSFADSTLEKLVAWLPAEDWGPILDALRCVRPASLQALSERIREQGLTALDRRIRRALARACTQAVRTDLH